MEVKRYFGSSNFESHKIHFYPEKAIVRPAVANYIFYGIFLVVGLGILLAGLFSGELEAMAAMGVFGTIFAAAGFIFIWRTATKKLPEIDLWEKKFYPGGRAADPYLENAEYIPLEDFERFEFESRRIRGSKNSYTCYTLIMVFKDGRAFEILNHGSRKGIARDGGELARLLNKPLPEFMEPDIKISAKTLIPVLVFGIIWLSVACFMAWQVYDGTGGMQGDLLNLIPVLLFPLVGVIVVVTVVVAMVRCK